MLFIKNEDYSRYPTNNERCQSCKFYNSTYHNCDYLERTGKLRKCPVENCAKWEKQDGSYKLSPGDFLVF